MKPQVSGIGTRLTGFASSSSGPFRCGNCQWEKDGRCDHPIVKADPQLASRLGPGGVRVDHGDCCNYFRGPED